jgi:hypothetical protein
MKQYAGLLASTGVLSSIRFAFLMPPAKQGASERFRMAGQV